MNSATYFTLLPRDKAKYLLADFRLDNPVENNWTLALIERDVTGYIPGWSDEYIKRHPVKVKEYIEKTIKENIAWFKQAGSDGQKIAWLETAIERNEDDLKNEIKKYLKEQAAPAASATKAAPATPEKKTKRFIFFGGKRPQTKKSSASAKKTKGRKSARGTRCKTK
uniref:Uncharacterized protein n=1 Tax=viral metagenome TaxID=1070528 RepID=A0A6C0I5P3_9ZZZZ